MTKNVNINIRIDPELRHRLNVAAAEADMSVSSLITAQIEAVLKNDPSESRVTALRLAKRKAEIERAVSA